MASQLLDSFDVVDGALQAYEDINVLPESELEARRDLSSSAAQDPTSLLPELTAEEVRKLVSPILGIEKLIDETISETGFILWRNGEGADFELSFKTSKSAHFVELLLSYHYVKGPGGIRYSIDVVRKTSPCLGRGR
jgi:hypothetical protein